MIPILNSIFILHSFFSSLLWLKMGPAFNDAYSSEIKSGGEKVTSEPLAHRPTQLLRLWVLVQLAGWCGKTPGSMLVPSAHLSHSFTKGNELEAAMAGSPQMWKPHDETQAFLHNCGCGLHLLRFFSMTQEPPWAFDQDLDLWRLLPC